MSLKRFTKLFIVFAIAFAGHSSIVSAQSAYFESSKFSAPNSLTLTASGMSSLYAEWAGVNGATAYEVRVYDLSNGTSVTTTVPSMSRMVTGLESGHAYRVGVAPIFSGSTPCDFIVGETIIP